MSWGEEEEKTEAMKVVKKGGGAFNLRSHLLSDMCFSSTRV